MSSRILKETKKLKKANFLKYKQRKREYYLKSKYKNYKEIDYAAQLDSENFLKNIKIIAKNKRIYC